VRRLAAAWQCASKLRVFVTRHEASQKSRHLVSIPGLRFEGLSQLSWL